MRKGCVNAIEKVSQGHGEYQQPGCRRIKQAAKQKAKIGDGTYQAEFKHDLEQRHFICAVMGTDGIVRECAGAIAEECLPRIVPKKLVE